MVRSLKYMRTYPPAPWKVQLCNRNSARNGTRKELAGYYSAINFLDSEVGRILQRLEELDRKWAEGERVLREFAAGFADQSDEDIEREVAKAIAEVRAEQWAERDQPVAAKA